MAASRYRIVLRGRLSERFASAFDGMTLEHGPNRTVLVGDVRDQAQLYGLLGQLQEFGIELLAVEPADGGGCEPGPGPVLSGLPARQPVLVNGLERRPCCWSAMPFSRAFPGWAVARCAEPGISGQLEMIVVRSRRAVGGCAPRERTMVTPASPAPGRTAWMPRSCS
jgi:hypothetical protein